MSATLGDTHRQPGGRDVTYWVAYGELGDGTVFIGAVFTAPMWTTLGSVDLTQPRSDTSLEFQGRSAVISFIDTTEFGQGRQPGPEWIGWSGGML